MLQGHRCAQIRQLFETVSKLDLLQWWCGTKTEHQQQRLLELERENEHLRDAVRPRPREAPTLLLASSVNRPSESDAIDVVPSLALQQHEEPGSYQSETTPDIKWEPISALGRQYERTFGTPQLIICGNCGLAGPGNRLLSDEAPFVREQSRFKACHRCGGVWYCSLNCQMQHWRMHHRKVCCIEEDYRRACESV